MSFMNDKIRNGGEITSQGEFNKVGCFYIMLVPKSADAASVYVMNVQLADTTGLVDFPFMSSTWNPVVCTKLNVKSEDLTNYRIFYGME